MSAQPRMTFDVKLAMVAAAVVVAAFGAVFLVFYWLLPAEYSLWLAQLRERVGYVITISVGLSIACGMLYVVYVTNVSDTVRHADASTKFQRMRRVVVALGFMAGLGAWDVAGNLLSDVIAPENPPVNPTPENVRNHDQTNALAQAAKVAFLVLAKSSTEEALTLQVLANQALTDWPQLMNDAQFLDSVEGMRDRAIPAILDPNAPATTSPETWTRLIDRWTQQSNARVLRPERRESIAKELVDLFPRMARETIKQSAVQNQAEFPATVIDMIAEGYRISRENRDVLVQEITKLKFAILRDGETRRMQLLSDDLTVVVSITPQEIAEGLTNKERLALLEVKLKQLSLSARADAVEAMLDEYDARMGLRRYAEANRLLQCILRIEPDSSLGKIAQARQIWMGVWPGSATQSYPSRVLEAMTILDAVPPGTEEHVFQARAYIYDGLAEASNGPAATEARAEELRWYIRLAQIPSGSWGRSMVQDPKADRGDHPTWSPEVLDALKRIDADSWQWYQEFIQDQKR